jgi:flagellar biosynthetic protein FliP
MSIGASAMSVAPPRRMAWPGLMLAAVGAGVLLSAGSAGAQSISVDLGQAGGSVSSQIVRLVLLVTILSLAPSILVMVTSFTRIVIVLSFLRTAIGLQQTPPNAVLVGLALFLSVFIMTPTLEQAYRDGLEPLLAEEIDESEAMTRASLPLRAFMLHQVRPDDVALFVEIARLEPATATAEVPLRVLLPAFMISELRRAFEIGFLIFLPFLVIDMVVASVLMSMGMMMLPPVMVSLPFKLIFFVLVDGWALVVGSLVQSFAQA